MINPVLNGLTGVAMKKGKFGFILTDELYKKLNSLARANKKKPYDYMVDFIEKEYKIYIQQKLSWEGDDE